MSNFGGVIRYKSLTGMSLGEWRKSNGNENFKSISTNGGIVGLWSQERVVE